MIRPILKYGDALLHDRARPVEVITDEIRRLLDDMIET
ncbi:MAG: peptide deformylase, partial [Acidobacteria bacterium]